MARRNKTSPLEDLIEIASNIPWQASLAIALLSYAGFHYAAGLSMPAATNLHQMSDFIYKQLFITFSKFLQYIVPVAFLIGAGVSVFKRKYRSSLLDQQSDIESIRAMSWQDFELLVGEAFRRQGYVVIENGGGGADGGIDLVLKNNEKKTIVQCKRWKNYSINVSTVRELYGVMTAEGANECILVCCGNFTNDAKTFAKGKPIRLIDGPELVQLIGHLQAPSKKSLSSKILDDQVCPLCGSEMIRRVAKKGAHAGNEFWGCSRFPACRGVR